jgi:DNA-binding NtrC family response regulator
VPPLVSPVSSVLIVDDEPQMRSNLSLIFKTCGVKKLFEASTAQMAFEILEKESFEVLVVDYRMVGMDGVTFLTKLRAMGNNTPVVMLSGQADTDGVIRATLQDKVDFLGKPFQIPSLFASIDKLVRPRSSIQAITNPEV